MKRIREKILWWAAKRRIDLDQPKVIAITGSIAKTSTKIAIGTVLKKHFPREVRIGYGNLNTFLGVPLAILGFKIDFHHQKISWQWPLILLSALLRSLFSHLPKYMVLEFGADQKGDIEELAKQLKTDVAVITITGNSHLENYNSTEEIAVEKAKILDSLKSNGFSLVNSKDKNLPKLKSAQKQILVETELESISINFARQLAKVWQLDSLKTEEALSTLIRPDGRLQLKDLGSIRLLDDTYNASPLSVEAALNVLSRLPGRKVAILGDMLELGVESKSGHQQVGEIARQKADIVIGVGSLAKDYGFNIWFPDVATAIHKLSELIVDGDSVLIKGSRGAKMEVIVKALINQYNRNRDGFSKRS